MGMKRCPNQLVVSQSASVGLREKWRQRLTGPRSDIQLPGRFKAIAKDFKGLSVVDKFAFRVESSIGLIET